MRGIREATKGIIGNKRLYDTTPEIQAFTGLDSAIVFFRYTDRSGDDVSPIDRESFEGIGLSVLKELSEGIHWARNAFGIGDAMPSSIRRATLDAYVLGDYDDSSRVVRYRKGLTRDFAFTTGVHEMAHHADNIMGHPSADVVREACGQLKASGYSQSQINGLKMEIAREKWRDSHEVMAYSLDKYCVGKGNVLAQAIARAFIRRCEER